MANRYLEKIAKFHLFNSKKERDLLDVVALGGSAAGLTMGANSLRNNQRNAENSTKQVQLQHETVKALRDISSKVQP